jgi:hypothetical protein
MRVLRLAAPALVLATLVLAPFLDKAFTIDDTVFLAEARHAVQDPLHPTAFDYPWFSRPQRVSRIVPTGPVMAWLLVPAILSDRREVVAHVTQLLLLWLAILATVALALLQGLPPTTAAAAGLLLASTPAVLGIAGTAMPDIAAVALGTAGVACFVQWYQERRIHQAVLAALILGMAPLARTHLLPLVALALPLAVGNVISPAAWRRVDLKALAPLALAVAVTFLVTLVTRDPLGGSHSISGAAAMFSRVEHVGPNSVAFLVHWVLVLPFALPWFALRWRQVLRLWPVLVGGALLASVTFWATDAAPIAYVVAPAAALGLAALWDLVLDAVRRRDGLQLALGSWLVMALPAVVYIHFPSKYLIVSAPAAALLVAREARKSERLGRSVLAGAVFLGVVLSVAVLRADAAFAGAGRTAARALIAPLVRSGHTVWYVGHWGFQWYAEEAGGRIFPVDPPLPPPGDLVVASERSAPHVFVEGKDWLRHVGRAEFREPGGRSMDMSMGVGFFSSGWGYLPWGWGSDMFERFDVFVEEP